jgi:pyruvate kinase
MRRNRHVKIIATIGPASATREVIERLFHCGADVFRINMSHATKDDLAERVGIIRSIEAEHGRPIGILVDLQGPKLRVGSICRGRAPRARRQLRSRRQPRARRPAPGLPAAPGDLRVGAARASICC